MSEEQISELRKWHALAAAALVEAELVVDGMDVPSGDGLVPAVVPFNLR